MLPGLCRDATMLSAHIVIGCNHIIEMMGNIFPFVCHKTYACIFAPGEELCSVTGCANPSLERKGLKSLFGARQPQPVTPAKHAWAGKGA